ncbi:MAG TPA: FAD binding domain-containing protein, partial [Polyangia bacterium]
RAPLIAAAGIDVLRPRHLKDALMMLRVAADEGRPLVPLAGGTDLFVTLNAGAKPAARYLDLWRLDKLRGVDGDGKRRLSFGGLATFTDCIESKAVRKKLPILVEAARQVGGVQIQNRGTLAGNIENGSPAADGVPVLMAADATVVLRSLDEERRVPLASYYVGYRKTVRRADELIVRIEVDVPDGAQRFAKVGTRAAQAISKVVMAAVGHRVAFGSVAPVIVRAHKLEAYVAGGGRDVAEAKRLVAEDVTPIDDVRSTAEYRRRVVENLVAAWLPSLDAAQRARRTAGLDKASPSR